MANIAISDIQRDAETIEDTDYLLVSKSNGSGGYTSAKITGAKFKESMPSGSGGSSTCNFDANVIQSKCESAIDAKLSSINSASFVALDYTKASKITGNKTLNSDGILYVYRDSDSVQYGLTIGTKRVIDENPYLGLVQIIPTNSTTSTSPTIMIYQFFIKSGTEISSVDYPGTGYSHIWEQYFIPIAT